MSQRLACPGIVLQWPPGAHSRGPDAIAPFVQDGFVGRALWEHWSGNVCCKANVFQGKFRRLAAPVVGLANGRAVVQIVAPIIEKLALQNMVGVHGRRPAENALVLGASKDLVLERFAAQKGWCVHGVSHLVFFAGAFLTGAFAGADLAAIFVP